MISRQKLRNHIRDVTDVKDLLKVGEQATMSFMESCRKLVKGRGMRIVYPEGVDERARKAAVQLKNEGLGAPIVLG